MLTKKQVQDICNDLANRSAVDGVLLTGSYAYGRPSDNSDLDIRVVTNDGSNLADVNRYIDGTKLEVLWNSPEKVRFYFEECMTTGIPYAVHFWAFGKISTDHTGIIATLREEARQLWKRGPYSGEWQHQAKWFVGTGKTLNDVSKL